MSKITDFTAPSPGPAHALPRVTQTVRAGIECGDPTGCVVPPLHLTSTFAFRAFGEKRAYDYTRSGNPTRDLLAEALSRSRAGRGRRGDRERHGGRGAHRQSDPGALAHRGAA